MLYGGLVSITFRQLSPKRIVNLVAKSGIKGIEWGGDIHVPHGNISLARNVGNMTREEGLKVAAYGSYYRVGCEGEEGIPCFQEVLETAIELKAPSIRVWAGNRSSIEATRDWWDNVVEDSIRIAEMASREGIIVAYEYHGGTLTDTLPSTYKLLDKVAHKNLRSYWQPLPHHDIKNRLDGLEQILPWLGDIHVFHWLSGERKSLEGGTEEWLKYLKLIDGIPDNRYAMIEFVKDDNEEQFLQDAKILKQWIDKV
ncbi:MAG TPA: TIM barrel protein [Clostridia bacterium]|nr:TIM barrel protein [Clostridia bacterium]